MAAETKHSASVAVLIAALGSFAIPGQAADRPDAAVRISLHEPLDRDWAAEWVSLPVELPPGAFRPGEWTLAGGDGPIECVCTSQELHPDKTVKRGIAWVYTGLRAGETKSLHVVRRPQAPPPLVTVCPDGSDRTILSTDTMSVRTAGGSRSFERPADCSQCPAPVLGVRRGDGGWTAVGQLSDLGPIAGYATQTDTSVPHRVVHTIRYRPANGGEYTVTLTLTAHEPAVVVEEDFSKLNAGSFVLDLNEGLQPTMGHGRGRLSPPGGARITSGYKIDFAKEWTGRLQPYYAWWPDYGLWWAAYRPQGDYVGILPLNPPGWTNPRPNTLYVRTGPGQRVQVTAPLQKGTRRWAIVMAPADEAMKTSAGGAFLMQRMVIRLGQNPLDRVKDLVLTWPGMDAVGNPRLLCSPEDIPRIRQKARTHPLFKRVLEDHPEAPGDPAGLYLATGDEKHARQAIDDLLRFLRGQVEAALDGENYGEALNAIGFTRPLRSYALVYDLVAGSASMTPQERDYCLRALAFMAWCLRDENRWPARNQGFHRGNINFHSDDYTCVATVAALLAGHPKQQEWMDYVEREMKAEFADCVFPGGAWCEAPNYQGYTLHYLIIAMCLMQRNGFADFAGEPRFRDTMDYFYRIQTPYDVRAGMHLLPTVGDTTSYYHSQSLQNVFAWSAGLFRDDPALAGRMMLAWRRGGSVVFGAHGLGPGNGWTQPLTLIDPDIPETPSPPTLTSERLPGYGALLRNNYGTDRESYFLFKMGPIGQHFDSDEGSFHWYALGRPISLDFGSMYTPSIEQPWLHSTLDFDRQRIWTQGEITRFTSFPSVDYCASIVKPAHFQRVVDDPRQPAPPGLPGPIQRRGHAMSWQRQVLFVKGGDYVVMRDDMEDADHSMPTGWTLQVLADRADVDGGRARCLGQHGVDLDVLMTEPADAKLATSTWGHDGQPSPDWVAPTTMPAMGEMQIALHATAPPDGDYLVAMFPYRHSETAPELSSAGDGVIRIARGDDRDLVFLPRAADRMQADGACFTGRVGLLQRSKTATAMHILDGVAMEIPELIVQCTGPLTVGIEGRRLRGETDGAGRPCILRWTNPPWLAASLTIDGKEAPVCCGPDGCLSFMVPEGRHVFEVTYEAPAEEQRRTVRVLETDREFTVHLGGTMDASNTCSYQNVYQPVFQPNVELTLTNVGEVPVKDPRISINGTGDWFDMQSLVQAGVGQARGNSDEEKSFALWDFFRRNIDAGPGYDKTLWGDTRSVVRFMNCFGSGACGTFHRVMPLVGYAGGLQTVAGCLADCSHAVQAEIYDGAQRYFDALIAHGDASQPRGFFMLDLDNRTVSSVQSCMEDHYLVERVGTAPGFYMCVSYFGPGSSFSPLRGDDGQDPRNMGITLRPGESISRKWTPVRQGWLNEHPSPASSAQVAVSFEPRLTHEALERDAVMHEHVQAVEGGIVAGEQAGVLVYEMYCPYAVIGAQAAAVLDLPEQGFEPARIALSFDNQQWQDCWRPQHGGPQTAGFLDDRSPPFHNPSLTHRVWFRVDLPARSHLSFLRMTLHGQAYVPSLPALRVGANTVRYRDSTPGPHAVRIDHRWQESSRLQPPEPPAEAVSPADGSEAGFCPVFEWAKPAGDIDAYEFYLSARQDLAWPLLAPFHSIVHGDSPRFPSPVPDALNDGQSYYWRVRARVRGGLWGEWSKVWSFTARGPGRPTMPRIERQQDREIFRWDAPAGGRPVVRYDVFGSDSSAVSPRRTAASGDNGGKNIELPAMLLGSTETTSFDITGRPEVFYRVVAIDRAGSQSPPTQTVSASRPVWLPGEPPSIRCGQPYRYRPAVRRSTGRWVLSLRKGAVRDQVDDLQFEVAGPDWLKWEPAAGELRGTAPAAIDGPVRVTLNAVIKGVGSAKRSFDIPVE